MYRIITNSKGSRSIDISDQNIETIEKYKLLDNFVSSTGMVTEEDVHKLQLHVKSLLENIDNDSALLDLCKNVIFHDNMKAIGLKNLIKLCEEKKLQEDSDNSTDKEE